VAVSVDVDDLHRTAKQLFESGQARTLAHATKLLQELILQIDVGPGLQDSPAGQAALLTAVNAGRRAFLGGVAVRIDGDSILTEGWGAGQAASSAVIALGGTVVAELSEDHPTVAITAPGAESVGSIIIRVGWNGWSGGIVPGGEEPPQRGAVALAGSLAGALGVGEVFQHCCGSPEAARRDVGISLWRPGADWRSQEAHGPQLRYLPSSLWLLGLGHLGQAYAWSLGFLPYANPAELEVYLMDTDSLVSANLATGLIARELDLGHKKTRVCAAALESIGFRTMIVERLYDQNTWPTADEPMLALGGFDSPIPRSRLGDHRFERVIDAGLGAGPIDYLDMLLFSFPSQLDPRDAFASPERAAIQPLPERYSIEVEQLIAAGRDRAEAECGVAEIAGVSVAAAFVGATAAVLVIADVLRLLHGGPDLAVLALDLRTPNRIDAVENTAGRRVFNPGFAHAREEPRVH
jgi:hypothetical protein